MDVETRQKDYENLFYQSLVVQSNEQLRTLQDSVLTASAQIRHWHHPLTFWINAIAEPAIDTDETLDQIKVLQEVIIKEIQEWRKKNNV